MIIKKKFIYVFILNLIFNNFLSLDIKQLFKDNKRKFLIFSGVGSLSILYFFLNNIFLKELKNIIYDTNLNENPYDNINIINYNKMQLDIYNKKQSHIFDILKREIEEIKVKILKKLNNQIEIVDEDIQEIKLENFKNFERLEIKEYKSEIKELIENSNYLIKEKKVELNKTLQNQEQKEKETHLNFCQKRQLDIFNILKKEIEEERIKILQDLDNSVKNIEKIKLENFENFKRLDIEQYKFEVSEYFELKIEKLKNIIINIKDKENEINNLLDNIKNLDEKKYSFDLEILENIIINYNDFLKNLINNLKDSDFNKDEKLKFFNFIKFRQEKIEKLFKKEQIEEFKNIIISIKSKENEINNLLDDIKNSDEKTYNDKLKILEN